MDKVTLGDIRDCCDIITEFVVKNKNNKGLSKAIDNLSKQIIILSNDIYIDQGSLGTFSIISSNKQNMSSEIVTKFEKLKSLFNDFKKL